MTKADAILALTVAAMPYLSDAAAKKQPFDSTHPAVLLGDHVREFWAALEPEVTRLLAESDRPEPE